MRSAAWVIMPVGEMDRNMVSKEPNLQVSLLGPWQADGTVRRWRLGWAGIRLVDGARRWREQ